MQCLIVLVSLAASAMAGLAYGPYGGYAGTADYRYHGPPAPLAHDGRVLDTPEVAHAKAAHLAAHAAEASKAVHSGGYGEDYVDGYYGNGYAAGHEDYVAAKAYHGPPAPLAHDGRVLDTPEVAHAKAAHFAAYADELAKTGPHHVAYGHPQW